MVRHWNRHLRTERDPRCARRMKRSRIINGVGAVMPRHGAGRRPGHQVHARRRLAIAAMVVLFFMMRRIHRHYDRVRAELARRRGRRRAPCCPRGCTRSCWSPRSTSRRCAPSPTPGRPGPRILEAHHRQRRPGRDQGAAGGVGPPRHPGAAEGRSTRRYREITRPVIDYVKSIRARQPARRRHGLHPASTSSGTGGSSCCTTRARCGSRAGCCSPPASWSPACRGSSRSAEGSEDAARRARSRATCAAARAA